jgi:hypothetical protein
VLDVQWKDHLHSMDGLRDGINLRGYAQRDPKIEYQREGYSLFEEMNDRIDAGARDPVRRSCDRRGAGPPPRRRPPRSAAAAPRAAPAPGSARRRCRRGRPAPRRAAEGGAQRSLPLRLRPQVQEVLRRGVGAGVPIRVAGFRAAGVRCGV